jgi:hypothetical protein
MEHRAERWPTLVTSICRVAVQNALCFFAKTEPIGVFAVPGNEGTLSKSLLNQVWYLRYEEDP